MRIFVTFYSSFNWNNIKVTFFNFFKILFKEEQSYVFQLIIKAVKNKAKFTHLLISKCVFHGGSWGIIFCNFGFLLTVEIYIIVKRCACYVCCEARPGCEQALSVCVPIVEQYICPLYNDKMLYKLYYMCISYIMTLFLFLFFINFCFAWILNVY